MNYVQQFAELSLQERTEAIAKILSDRAVAILSENSNICNEYYKYHEENSSTSNNLAHIIKLEEIEDETISDLNEEQYGYHESNPKIDLHNKHSGMYIASTNYAKNIKQAVQKYEEKFPDMKGHVRGYINKK